MSEVDPTLGLRAITPLAYEELVRSTAYFQTEVPTDLIPTFLSRRLNEEVDELLCITDSDQIDEKVQLLWGLDTLPIERKAELQAKMASELGDCLYFLVAGAMTKGITLQELINEASRKFTGQEQPVTCTTLNRFDQLMANRMGERVRNSYDPDYNLMQRFGARPYYEAEPPDDLSGLQVLEDGYYALHNALSYVSNFMSLGPDSYKKAASIALGVFSAIAQDRLDSSLAEIAAKNMDKLTRRMEKGTLRQGDDIERERVSDADRPDYSTWCNTVALLIGVPKPNPKGNV